MRRLALRMLVRDWRAGELRVLALALVLAVGGVASVAFFADRVRQALTREAHQVLVQPLTIRQSGRHLLLDFFITDDALFLGVHQKHTTRLQATFFQNLLGWHFEHADL